MEQKQNIYIEQFPKGSNVRTKDRAFLTSFRQTWRFHNPLSEEQLDYSGKAATVASVGFYHGGDVLYTLSDIPGVWHERCLERHDEPRAKL